MISARFPVADLPKVRVGERDRIGNIGAAFRDGLGVEIVDRIDGGVVVDREGRLEEGAAGKGDQADAIALQLVDQILRREFDPLETIRLHVVREHAARNVDREEQVESLAFHLVVGVAPARSRQANEDEAEDEKEKDEAKDAPAAIDRPGQLRQQTRGDKFLQLFCAELLGAGEEKAQQRQHEQGPKPERVMELKG